MHEIGIMNQRLTQALTNFLQGAQSEALRREHQQLSPEHLLYAFVSDDHQEEGISNLLMLSGVTIPALKAALETRLNSFPKVLASKGELYPSPEFQKWIAFADEEAKKLKDEYLAPEHFVLALLNGSLS